MRWYPTKLFEPQDGVDCLVLTDSDEVLVAYFDATKNRWIHNGERIYVNRYIPIEDHRP
nr:MAG TPA: hypothetical protein [Caudoviricetes sp.]